ncbi:MAG TPA: phospholipase D-like domain-containing protein [Allosphingosinicella sp.]|nr:phospholipase D-like domain-containing protein [Allosphingosinicella sp.]
MASSSNTERCSDGPLTVVLRRGEQMCLIGMNVDPPPALDFVGFAIAVKSPKSDTFWPLRNRLAFSYPEGAEVSGFREHPTDEAPLQTFRWIHFPQDAHEGEYQYCVTMMHMDAAGTLSAGAEATATIILCGETVPGALDVGFTRNFASSQAFTEKFPDPASWKTILPPKAEQGLSFDKSKAPAGIYDWLGGKANDLLADTLKAAADPATTLDVMAYDLNEPDFVATLETIARRGSAAAPALRILIDNSGEHAPATSAESQAAARLQAAGASVVRHHFAGLQHNKVLVLRRAGVPVQAIGGSTNFSFRGLYIQANNMLSFKDAEIAGLFGQAFEIAFKGAAAWAGDPFQTIWHAPASSPLSARVCFSPHPGRSDLSLTPLTAAIEQASSSVLYAIAFLNQDTIGPVRKALDILVQKPLFSYGIVNRDSGLKLIKPDGSQGVVDFEYLAAHAPEPFKSEWSGGGGITIHHKFVVTDFNLPTARVFAGSSNLSKSGEEGNGDHLVQIGDSRVATAYAVEALRMFDHLNFRTKMKAADGKVKELSLQKPPQAGEQAWFAPFYIDGSQKGRDRMLFGS